MGIDDEEDMGSDVAMWTDRWECGSDDDGDEIDEIKADQTLSSSSLECNDDGDDDR